MAIDPKPTVRPYFFASDLHGRLPRWQSLLQRIEAESPAAVFLGGDLCPHVMSATNLDHEHGFLMGWLGPQLRALRQTMGDSYPRILTILGNDDPAFFVDDLEDLQAEGLLEHIHMRRTMLSDVPVYGCAWVPPSPFQLKDWERYDVGRGVDPGCVPPEEGRRTTDVDDRVLRNTTITSELEALVGDADLTDAVVLFHAPPYRTALDRAALDGQMVEHVPLDVHIGSIAIRRFLEAHGPAVALCGHVHESARLTGQWRDSVGDTAVFGAAHDGPELALVRFEARDPGRATRELI